MTRFSTVGFALAIVVTISVPQPAASQAREITMDGTWWRLQSDSAKQYIVRGLVEGLTIGYFHGQIDAAHFHGIQFSKTFSTYVHGVDDFYVNYPKAIGGSVGAAVFCQRDDSKYSCDEWGKSMTASIDRHRARVALIDAVLIGKPRLARAR